MATIANRTEFLSIVAESQLLSNELLEELRVDPQLSDSPGECAEQLIHKGLLTRFQTKRLLVGKYRGFVFGPYRIKDQIGKGGMGTVYLCEHSKLGRKVAVKVLAPELIENKVAVERFLREARSASALCHPNIVRVHHVGQASGTHYMVMEYVDGATLEQVVDRKGPFAITEASWIAVQVAAGLQHAHERGFVHRDIKPENILVGRGARGLTAKISDFGLAKSYRSIGLSGLTFSGEMRGTIPFMPPEQMLEFKKVQPSGDLYSTAATLYYLIAGDYIYDQPLDGGGDLIRMLLEEQPIPIRERRDSVPEELDAILERCLAREPEDRFPDAGSLRAALLPFC